jgi:ABC-type anion transport system duplicated permease subunit
LKIDPRAKLTLPNALVKTSPIDEEKAKELAQAREELWNTPAVIALIMFVGVPVGVYIVLQIRAIYRTRGVWRIFAILAIAPAAFIFSFFFAMGFVDNSNFWFLPLCFLILIVYLLFYLLFLDTKFVQQRQKLTVLKCPKCDNEIRNPLEKGIPKGQRLEISCPKCHFSFNID